MSTARCPPMGDAAATGARETLKQLTSAIDGHLGSGLLGLYLFGSLAAGGFYPGKSDLDLMAIVAAGLSTTDFSWRRQQSSRWRSSSHAVAAGRRRDDPEATALRLIGRALRIQPRSSSRRMRRPCARLIRAPLPPSPRVAPILRASRATQQHGASGMLVEEEAPGSGTSSSNQVTFKPSSRSDPQRLAISATKLRPRPPSSLGAFGVAACGEPSETSTLKTLRSTLIRSPTYLGPQDHVPRCSSRARSRAATLSARAPRDVGADKGEGVARSLGSSPFAGRAFRSSVASQADVSILERSVSIRSTRNVRSCACSDVMSPFSVPSAMRSRAWASRTPPASRTLVLVALVESVGRHGRSYPHKPEIKQAGQTC